MFHWPEEVPLFCASTQLHVLEKKTNHQASSCLARTAYESFLNYSTANFEATLLGHWRDCYFFETSTHLVCIHVVSKY